MDILLAKKLFDKSREGYSDKIRRRHHNDKEKKKAFWVSVIISIIFTLIFGIPAAILSWMSNTTIGWNPYAKVFFAFFAFLMGFNYLIIHLVNKLDLLIALKKLSPSTNAALPFVPSSPSSPSPSS